MNRARGARRRELDDVVVVRGEVGVEPPPETPVELLGALDIRDRDDDDLELHVDLPDAPVVLRVLGVAVVLMVASWIVSGVHDISEPIHVDDGLRERRGRFLRQVVSDAARDQPVRVLAR